MNSFWGPSNKKMLSWKGKLTAYPEQDTKSASNSITVVRLSGNYVRVILLLYFFILSSQFCILILVITFLAESPWRTVH